jgi:hypothetical protein
VLVGRLEVCLLLTLPFGAYLGNQGIGQPNWIIESPAYLMVWSMGMLLFGVTHLKYSRASVKLFLAHNRRQQGTGVLAAVFGRFRAGKGALCRP